MTVPKAASEGFSVAACSFSVLLLQETKVKTYNKRINELSLSIFNKLDFNFLSISFNAVLANTGTSFCRDTYFLHRRRHRLMRRPWLCPHSPLFSLAIQQPWVRYIISAANSVISAHCQSPKPN